MSGEPDIAFMTQAMRLAENGRYTAHPNPVVGCVIVRDGQVVAVGWHRSAGEAHAEANALETAGEQARGSTVYVTLEPCSHHGKTPPCADALIAAGVAEVVIGTRDPNPDGGGNGVEKMEAAGISVRIGVLEADVRQQIAGFLKRMTVSRPFVTLKMACSIDGRIAMASGESQWITGPEARADVQRLRARSGAILTGIGTVLADDPSFTVRDPDIDTLGRQPVRAVMDADLRMPLSAEMLALPGTTLIYCGDDGKRQPLIDAGAKVIKVDHTDGRVSAGAVLEDLARREFNDVLVEAGPILAGNLLVNNLVDELVIYQAPHIMGSETMGMFETPTWTELSQRKSLQITDTCAVGPDTRITARMAG